MPIFCLMMIFNSLLSHTKLLENARAANSGDIKKEIVPTSFMAMLNKVSQLLKQSHKFHVHSFVLSGWKSRLFWGLYVKLHDWKLVVDIQI